MRIRSICIHTASARDKDGLSAQVWPQTTPVGGIPSGTVLSGTGLENDSVAPPDRDQQAGDKGEKCAPAAEGRSRHRRATATARDQKLELFLTQ